MFEKFFSIGGDVVDLRKEYASWLGHLHHNQVNNIIPVRMGLCWRGERNSGLSVSLLVFFSVFSTNEEFVRAILFGNRPSRIRSFGTLEEHQEKIFWDKFLGDKQPYASSHGTIGAFGHFLEQAPRQSLWIVET